MDYSVEIEPGKVKTYHINMLEWYYYGNEQVTQKPVGDGRDLCQHTDETRSEQNNTNLCHKSQQWLPVTSRELEVEDVVTQALAIACVLEDNDQDEEMQL